MEIKKIDINLIDPNPWNPNQMDGGTFAHLLAEFKRVGCIQPILVRPVASRFQIIDGENRWRAGKEFGMTSMDAVVKEMTDDQAKVTTINMNKIKGSDDPIKLAELLKALSGEIEPADLSALINIKQEELNLIIELVEMPEGILDKPEVEKKQEVKCPKCGEVFTL
jgi:ParB family chromosome partitioning protein